jgi:hypothetical protein
MEQKTVISSGKTIILKDLTAATSIAMDANVQVEFGTGENAAAATSVDLGTSALGQEVGIITCTLADTLYAMAPTVRVPYLKKADWTLHVTPVGVEQIETQTYPATAGATQADYINIYNTAGEYFAVWLDIDAAGTAPTGALYVASDFQIEVDIVGGDSAIQVAGKVKAAIELDGDWDGYDTIVDNGDGTLTFTSSVGGVLADSVPKDDDDAGVGSITVVVDTDGAVAGTSQVYIKVSQYKD